MVPGGCLGNWLRWQQRGDWTEADRGIVLGKATGYRWEIWNESLQHAHTHTRLLN